MFLTPYQTTVCKDYVVDRIVQRIKEEQALNSTPLHMVETNPLTDKEPEAPVFMVGPDHSDIPPFAHPLFLDMGIGREGDEDVVLDVRNFTRLDRNNQLAVSSQLDYKLAVIRGILSHYWRFNAAEDMLNLGHFQVKVYARWLTDVISRRLALTPDIQVRVTVIAAYFYLCMFQDSDIEELDDKQKQKIITIVNRSTGVAAEKVLEITDRLGLMRSVHDFVAALAEVGESARLKDFNLGLLYAVVGGSWFGSNHREIVALGLEHPPTFISLMAMALDERGYRRTVLGKTIEINAKRGDDRNFLYNLRRLPM